MSTTITVDYMDLARCLQHSNIKEISQLAEGYLKLAEKFDDIMGRYVKLCGEKVMDKHAGVFKRLRDSGD